MSEVKAALRGSIHGATRTEIIAQARQKTAAYFGTECVTIKLEDEKPHPLMSGFTASFVGIVWHDVESRTYGPGKCRGCKKEDWPQHPLNAVSKKEWL